MFCSVGSAPTEPNRPLIIRTQYGDDSIALVQWAYEAGFTQVQTAYVDTGWAASQWQTRIPLVEQHIQSCGFTPHTIVSKISFEAAVRGRGEFPSPQFQWCSALLKGLPFLDWLDKQDPRCQAIILIAKRKEAATAHSNLLEWIKRCEFHNDRTVWHPILNLSTPDRNALLNRAGFEPLNHRSLECHPCVNSTLSDFANLTESDIQRTFHLESEMNTPMFTDPNLGNSVGIRGLVKDAKANLKSYPHYLDLFYRGCGNHFGCGV